MADHPRSRGVYARQIIHAVGVARIIPARAGFTLVVSRMPATCRDHPRSRGVYLQKPNEGLEIHGSSPLARGLLVWRGLRTRLRRIIPARAGFTL